MRNFHIPHFDSHSGAGSGPGTHGWWRAPAGMALIVLLAALALVGLLAAMASMAYPPYAFPQYAVPA